MHFFDDNARVVEQVAAAREGNLEKFFAGCDVFRATAAGSSRRTFTPVRIRNRWR